MTTQILVSPLPHFAYVHVKIIIHTSVHHPFHIATVYPGETFYVSVGAFGQRNGTVHPSGVRCYITTGNLQGFQYIQIAVNTCTTFNYTVFSLTPANPAKHVNIDLYADGPCSTFSDKLAIQLTIYQTCPPGFSLSEPVKACICEPRLATYTNNYNITGKGLEVAVVGEHTTAVLHALDEEGQEYDKSLENIQCELKSETNDIEVNCKVEKKYEISYTPNHRGIHQLSIRVKETHIRGSPFTVLVKLPIQRPGTRVKIIEKVTNPWGVAVRHNGEIIVAELRNRCVSVFAPNGKKIRTFGTKGSAHGQFKYPCGIAFDSAGNILVAEGGNHRIQKFTAEGQFLILLLRCSRSREESTTI